MGDEAVETARKRRSAQKKLHETKSEELKILTAHEPLSAE
jgi:hypothetical protein